MFHNPNEQVEREKDVQTHATIRAEQKAKEQSDLIFEQQRNASRLAKEVSVFFF